ncbi:MAG: DHHA1 domain-containing protein [Candidatus Verstraetearchaeota archaeon]|nr:DHHA1 domain-containing protein [Candidatus Verstraetearchaeota archaeon]
MDWILTHGDTDGMCSGAIALSAHEGRKVFFSHPSGLAEDLRQVDGDVIICDIALSSVHLKGVMSELERIKSGGNRIVYIDHHPLPKNLKVEQFPGELVNSTMSCASELTYTYFKDVVPADMSRVAIYGAIGDYLDRTYVIEKLLTNWEKRSLYLESGILIQAIDSTGRDYESKRKIVDLLASNRTPSSDEEMVGRAIAEAIAEEEMRNRIKEVVKTVGRVAYVLDLQWSMGKGAVYARAYGNALIGVGAERRKGYIDMSLRTTSDQLNLNEIITTIAPRHNGSGGGHPKAAGARVPEGEFSAFLKDLDASAAEIERKRTVEY